MFLDRAASMVSISVASFSSRHVVRHPFEQVYRWCSDGTTWPECFSRVKSVALLEGQAGKVGSRIRELRTSLGGLHETELELIEATDKRIAWVAFAQGIRWETSYKLRPMGDATVIEARYDAVPIKPSLTKNALASAMLRAIRGALQNDVDTMGRG